MNKILLFLSMMLLSAPLLAEQLGAGAPTNQGQGNTTYPAVSSGATRMEWEKRPNASRYADEAAAAVAKHAGLLTPTGRVLTDVLKACPRFSAMSPGEKKDFWVNFAMVVGMRESSLRPELGIKGPIVYSTGLYGNTVSTDADLKSKSKNPECIFENKQLAQNTVKDSECFFKHVMTKINDSNCLFCDTADMEVAALKSKKWNQKIQLEMKRYRPCQI